MATGGRARASVRVYGVVFLVLCVFFVWLTYAVFTKQFTKYDEVTLETSNIGLSLPARADVKVRGVIVGEVLNATTQGDGAELKLGLYPDQTSTIPKDVSALILPKTLFGEKYVNLRIPPNASSESIEAGDVIHESRVATELEAVLNDLFPLLRSVRPEELNYTLTALANALEGRGEKLGESFTTLDDYLRKVNPRVPDLITSIDRLGKVSATYDEVVPELTRLLRNTVTTANTLQDNEKEISTLTSDVAAFSGTARTFLRDNGDNLIELADQGRQILPLIARYAPEFRCFFVAATGLIPRESQAFRDKTLHIVLEVLPKQPRGYTPAEQPVNGAKNGPFPHCDLLDKATRGYYSQENLLPKSLIPDLADGVADGSIAKRAAVGGSVAGTRAEKNVLNLAAAPVLGVSPDEVPDLTTLLLGPLARGMEVNVR